MLGWGGGVVGGAPVLGRAGLVGRVEHPDLGPGPEGGPNGDVDQPALHRAGDAQAGQGVAVSGDVGRGRPEPGRPLVVEEQAGEQQRLHLAAAEGAPDPGAERGTRAVEGAGATLAALARGQVATLVLTGLFLDDRRTAWFGPAPTDVAADRDTLAGLGVPGPVEGRLVDVAVRAALGTGAEIRVLDPADETRPATDRGATHDAPAPPEHAPAEGLGALLRFPLGP